MNKSAIITCPTCGTHRAHRVRTCRKCTSVETSQNTKTATDDECRQRVGRRILADVAKTELGQLGRQRKRDHMSQTERKWKAMYPHHVFEPITLRLANGHSYTPDFVDWTNMLCIEVKGGFKLGSYQRARLAYDQAVLEFTYFNFAWFEWNRKSREFEQK